MWNILLHCHRNSYIIGAEGKIKINEARGDYFFTQMSRFGAIFLHLPHNDYSRKYFQYIRTLPIFNFYWDPYSIRPNP